MLKTLLLLLIYSLLTLSYASVEPIILCPVSGQSQVLEAAEYGVIKHDGSADIDCELTLTGHSYQTPLALTNIVNSISCYSNETVYIYVNNEMFCIRESPTSLEVVLFNVSSAVNISIRHQQDAFNIQYYIADVLCEEGSYRPYVDVGRDENTHAIFISPGYVPSLPILIPPDCILEFINRYNNAVRYETVGLHIPNWGDEYDFRYRPRPDDPQQYNKKVTTNHRIDFYFDLWDIFVFRKFFIRYTVLVCEPPPAIGHGYYENFPTSPFLTGTRANILCKSGYKQYNQTQLYYVVCELTGEQMIWNISSTDPYICIPATECSDSLPEVPQTFYKLSKDNLTAEYHCIPGTISDVQYEVWICNSTDVNEIPWTWKRASEALNCSEICPIPVQIDNGVVLSYDPDKVYTHPDTLYYECDDGFTLFREMIICQSDGSWSPAAICISSDKISKTSNFSGSVANSDPTTNTAVLGLIVGLTISVTVVIIGAVMCLVTWRKDMWTWTGYKPASPTQQTELSEVRPDRQDIYMNVQTAHEDVQNNAALYENMNTQTNGTGTNQENTYEELQREPEQRNYERVARR